MSLASQRLHSRGLHSACLPRHSRLRLGSRLPYCDARRRAHALPPYCCATIAVAYDVFFPRNHPSGFPSMSHRFPRAPFSFSLDPCPGINWHLRASARSRWFLAFFSLFAQERQLLSTNQSFFDILYWCVGAHPWILGRPSSSAFFASHSVWWPCNGFSKNPKDECCSVGVFT
jgi:hypothetical protein